MGSGRERQSVEGHLRRGQTSGRLGGRQQLQPPIVTDLLDLTAVVGEHCHRIGMRVGVEQSGSQVCGCGRCRGAPRSHRQNGTDEGEIVAAPDPHPCVEQSRVDAARVLPHPTGSVLSLDSGHGAHQIVGHLLGRGTAAGRGAVLVEADQHGPVALGNEQHLHRRLRSSRTLTKQESAACSAADDARVLRSRDGVRAGLAGGRGRLSGL